MTLPTHLQRNASSHAPRACGLRLQFPLAPLTRDVVLSHAVAVEVTPHVDDAMELVVVQAPGLRFRHERRMLRPNIGAICTVQRGVLHGWSTTDGHAATLSTLHIGADYLERVFRDAGHAPIRRTAIPIIEDRDLSHVLASLLVHVAGDMAGALAWESCLIHVVTQLAERHGRFELAPPIGTSACHPGLRRVRELLEDDLGSSVGLDELSVIAGLSKFYLLRAFTRSYGLPPHAFQMQLRLGRARQLLLGGHAISRVAYDCGFSDQSHFTRRFKEYLGLTPARFARMARPQGASCMPLDQAA